MNKRAWMLLAAGTVVAVMTALARPAPASLLVALDTPTMVQQADAIAVVDVAATRAAWDERHERILTTVELSVVESWKGAMGPAARVTIVQPGGTVGDLTMVVFGMPRFVPGERALVFLSGPADRAVVVGMTQGKRLVRRDAARGLLVVDAPSRAGASFLRGAPGAEPPPAPAIFERGPRPLADLRAEIRALVTNGSTR